MAFAWINGNSNGQWKKELKVVNDKLARLAEVEERLTRLTEVEERLTRLENPSSTINAHVISTLKSKNSDQSKKIKRYVTPKSISLKNLITRFNLSCNHYYHVYFI